jgi:hypothetical protein
VPLEFGTAFHRAMEVMYDPTTWGQSREVIGVRAETAFLQVVQEQKKTYERNANYLDDEKMRDYKALMDLGVGMIRWYVKEHLPLGEFTPVAVEQTFAVPVLDPNGKQLRCACKRCQEKIARLSSEELHELAKECQVAGYDRHCLPVVYEGRIDALVMDAFGGFWILDWKTTMRMLNEDSEVVLETDDQVASYCWALRNALGLNIRGFIYVELKKGFPEPPNENKVRRLGRKFSVSKQINTDYQTYLKTVMTQDASAYQQGLYDEFINWLQSAGPRFYEAHKIPKPEQTLDNIGYYIYLQAKEMTNPELSIYPSPGRFTCGWCAFQGPCIDKTAGRDYEYALDTLYEIKPRYYENRKPSTDRNVS